MLGRGPTGFLTDGEAVAQRVYAALKLVLGMWFLDTTQGVAWMRQPAGMPSIMDQAFDQAFMVSELKRVILSVDGVSAIASFDFTVDTPTRKLTCTAQVQTVYGTVQPIVARFDN